MSESETPPLSPEDEREKARQGCLELMESLRDNAMSSTDVGNRTISNAELIAEIQNRTPFGEKMVDTYLIDQRKKAQMEIERQNTVLGKLRSFVAGLLKPIMGR